MTYQKPLTEVTISSEKLNKLFMIALNFQRRNMGGLAGQAMTHYFCLKCDQENIHGNTNVPLICNECEIDIKKNWERTTSHRAEGE